MFKLTKESGLTKVWVSLILGETYNYEQVPELFNLKGAVGEVLVEVGFIKVEEKEEELTKDE